MFIEMSTLIKVRRVREDDCRPISYLDDSDCILYDEGMVIMEKDCKRTINTDDIMDIIPNDNRWQMEDLYDRAMKCKIEYKPVRELITIKMKDRTSFSIIMELDEYENYNNPFPFVKDAMDKCEWFDNIQKYLYNRLINTIGAKRIIKIKYN